MRRLAPRSQTPLPPVPAWRGHHPGLCVAARKIHARRVGLALQTVMLCCLYLSRVVSSTGEAAMSRLGAMAHVPITRPYHAPPFLRSAGLPSWPPLFKTPSRKARTLQQLSCSLPLAASCACLFWRMPPNSSPSVAGPSIARNPAIIDGPLNASLFSRTLFATPLSLTLL